MKKISFEKFSHPNEGQRASCGFFNYVTIIGQTWSEEMCHWSPWVISPALPRKKNNSTAELEKHQDGRKHEISKFRKLGFTYKNDSQMMF